MADERNFVDSLNEQQRERLRELLGPARHTPLWKQVLAWILSSIGFLSLIDSLGWVTLRGYAGRWLGAYQRSVEHVSNALFGWAHVGWFGVTAVESHATVVWTIAWTAVCRSMVEEDGEGLGWRVRWLPVLLAAPLAVLLPTVLTIAVILLCMLLILALHVLPEVDPESWTRGYARLALPWSWRHLSAYSAGVRCPRPAWWRCRL